MLVSFLGRGEEAQTPLALIRSFYKAYLDHPASATLPKLPNSDSLNLLIKKNNDICNRYAGTDICGWGADEDIYLNSQESDPRLNYENSRFHAEEAQPGTVTIDFNVYPSMPNDAAYYQKHLTFLMIKENGRWVVDDMLTRITGANGHPVDVSEREKIKEENDAYLGPLK